MVNKDRAAGNLPIGHNEDVEYRAEMADEDDLEAQRRAKAADQREMSE